MPIAKTPRLFSYRIEGLFDRKPPWSMFLAEDGVTLITGSNGMGKTTILKTIEWASEGNWLQLFGLPFRALEFGFSDTSTLRIERSAETLTISHDDKEFVFEPSQIAPVDLDDLSFARGRGVIRLGATRYGFEGREYTKRQLSLFLGLRRFLEQGDGLWIAGIRDWFRVQFVADQRLVVQPEITPTPVSRQTRSLPTQLAVEEYADELAGEIRRTLANFFAASQDYDQTFPERVAEAMLDVEHPMSRDEVASLLERVTDERHALVRVGLIEPTIGPIAFNDRHLDNENVRQVVGTFAKDTLTKFERLQNFQNRLERLVDFVNDHFEEKRLLISREAGYRIQLNENAQLLRPSDLSSGEQHMLVLAYSVLFSTSPGTLVLIDEPEISLHVVWQAKLVDDLRRMGAVSDLAFVLATHSPSLIGPHEDLIRSLD